MCYRSELILNSHFNWNNYDEYKVCQLVFEQAIPFAGKFVYSNRFSLNDGVNIHKLHTNWSEYSNCIPFTHDNVQRLTSYPNNRCDLVAKQCEHGKRSWTITNNEFALKIYCWCGQHSSQLAIYMSNWTGLENQSWMSILCEFCIEQPWILISMTIQVWYGPYQTAY